METNPYILQGIEGELRSLFIKYNPVLVMKVWEKTLADFRQALADYDTKPQTIVLNSITEPVMKNPLVIPEQKPKAVVSDKEAQKEKLRLHKELITKKRQELASQGVIPETQLTDENLRKWIQTEKKTYWQIAELTGCNDADISTKAKSLNILSDMAKYIRHKRRTQI